MENLNRIKVEKVWEIKKMNKNRFRVYIDEIFFYLKILFINSFVEIINFYYVIFRVVIYFRFFIKYKDLFVFYVYL